MRVPVAITGFALAVTVAFVAPYIHPEGVGYLIAVAVIGVAMLVMALLWSGLKTLSKKLPWEFRVFYLGVEIWIVGFMLTKVYSEVAFF